MISLWLLDPSSGRLDPLVLDGDADSGRWTPDGQRVAFFWRSGGRRTVAWQRPDRGGAPEILVAEDTRNPGSSTDFGASSWSPDGRELAMVVEGDLAVAIIDGPRSTLRVLARTPQREQSPEFSPDGKWLAYSSDESGRHEVYVRAYPGDGPVQRVSVDGGSCPAWGKMGREMYFIGPPSEDGSGRMMVADVTPGASARIGTPRPLFEFGPDLLFPSTPMRSHAVSPDGERFYVVQSVPYPPLPPVTHVNLILNWFEELKAKVPAGGAK
jgi:serine/threonine-protein kinase